jgi:SAM-dependent methyltransferase
MYQSAKKFISRFLSNEQLMRHEPFLRSIYSVIYSGNKHLCAVCGKKLSKFTQLPNNDLLCPNCGSLARDRRLWTLLNGEFIKSGVRVLDFSPSRSLAREMKKRNDIEYISTDLSGNFIADFQYDITQLELPSDNIDIIVCYHILEHIPDDKKAMSELYRVLKNGGKALVQTPFKDGDIYEDYSITDPKEREIHFGQDDHVRFYSVAGLKERLIKSGFDVDVRHFAHDDFNGFKDETVLVLTKSL